MKRILVAALDWGLGHATRCIPIIRLIMREGHEPIIASSGSALRLLQAEFPHLISIELPPYNPEYPRSGSQMVWKMAMQLPKFAATISREYREVQKIAADHNIDAIISDNRYGCRCSAIPSAFLTHQSNIMMPKRFGWLEGPVRRLNESLMSKFDVCWIPSQPGDDSLAGNLISFGDYKRKINVQYVGMLSRFVKPTAVYRHNYKLLAIFSGPEPQRTLLEQFVTPQLEKSATKYFIVRGSFVDSLPGSNRADFLTANELEQKILESETVIARSGYSTIMDLATLEKKAIFIPTPGQTEQEYLANRLKDLGIAYFEDQRDFNLARALTRSQNYSGFTQQWTEESLLQGVFQKLINL